MMLWNSLGGMLEVWITGADPAGTLARFNEAGISIYDIRLEDDLTVRFRCAEKHRKEITYLCNKQGDILNLIGETGLLCFCRHILSRPLLTGGILLLLTLTALLPTRILFITVQGNSSVPKHLILESAEECGIRFGVSRRNIRSEQMKNSLLEKIPDLKWAGINTSGCTAVISVQEKQSRPAETTSSGISSIVAARDGRITSCTVTQGNPLCTPGQIVQEGQLLISGFTDCGICIRVTEAKGEVYAETRRETQVTTPAQCLVCIDSQKPEKRYSLILGKKRINFWKGSGISPVTCGRMYTEYYITLPGGFVLPICLRVETVTERVTDLYPRINNDLETGMQAFARASVLSSSVAGSILRQAHTLTEEKNGTYLLRSSFVCSEMIGRVITEEIGETNGKTD